MNDFTLGRIHLYADNFIGECAALSRCYRLLVRFERKMIEIFARKPVLFDKHFGALELAEHDAGIRFFEPRAFVVTQTFLHKKKRCRAHGHTSHAFDASG